MLFRIDYQHFLTHMIDYFSRNELVHFQYAIISAKITNTRKATNVSKFSDKFYPTTDMVLCYEEYHDVKILEKMYEELFSVDVPGSRDDWAGRAIYTNIINPVINHMDVLIICDRIENVYIDAFCTYLKKHYSLEAIDLNKLFSEGRVGPLYIDRDKIWDKAVFVRRSAGRINIEKLSATEDGRKYLLSTWTKKEKIAKLDELGIKTKHESNKELDKLLIDAWVGNSDEGD